jgi:hypothetical protein
MGAHMKKRILPVIIAILLILVIAGGALGKVLLDKYSYSKEEADWNEFYQVSESDRSAIILQDEMVEEQALIRDDVCYFDLATVHKYMNEVFYADMTEKLLLLQVPVMLQSMQCRKLLSLVQRLLQCATLTDISMIQTESTLTLSKISKK